MPKIQNLCIDIKVGKKEFHLKNLILNTFLNRYANSLIDEYDKNKRMQVVCMIKLDNPLEKIDEDLSISNKSFDLGIFRDSVIEEISTNKITTKYNWSNNLFSYDSYGVNPKWSKYNGRKICTLGFNYLYLEDILISSIIDVSNYDIYVEEGQEIFITRIDTISTEAIFTSSNIEKIKGPIHLASNGIASLIPNNIIEGSNGEYRDLVYNSYAKLTHVGLSNNPSRIERGLDLEYEVNNNVFTLKNLYSPSGLYPSNDLYPSDDVYLDDKPYDYLILKFTLYQDVDNGTYDTPNVVETDTGYWYLQAIPLDKKQEINLNIKYERG